jgi:hypothetical protein
MWSIETLPLLEAPELEACVLSSVKAVRGLDRLREGVHIEKAGKAQG